MIAVAVRVGGTGAGYQVGHLVLGSIVSIVCIGVSLVLLTVIVVSGGGELRSRILLPLIRPLSRLHRRMPR